MALFPHPLIGRRLWWQRHATLVQRPAVFATPVTTGFVFVFGGCAMRLQSCHAYLVVPSPWENTCHGEMMISYCWWNQEQGKEALGDLLLVLEGSPCLLEELSTSPEAWEGGCFSFLELLEDCFSSLKVETWYPFLSSLVRSSVLNRRLSQGVPGNILSTRQKSPTVNIG